MGIHKQGILSIIIVFIISSMGIIMVYNQLGINNYFFYIISLILFGFFCFITYFFRYPKLDVAEDKNVILSPADGKIVVIEDVFEDEYYNEKMTQISIFMSPLDTHLNRYPISGKMNYKKYHNGKYLVAWHPKSSYENERCTYALSNDKVSILVRQIAGAVARRIVPFHDIEKEFKQGDQLGFIKFGSRVDLFLPKNTKAIVKINQKVKAGRTVIAEID